MHIVTDNELAKLDSRVSKNEDVPIVFLYALLVNFVCFVILYFVNNLYSVIPMLLTCVFAIPYIVRGIMNFKYKCLTAILICLFFVMSLLVLKYLNPIIFFGIF